MCLDLRMKQGETYYLDLGSSSSTWRQQVHQTQQAPKEMVPGLSLDCNAVPCPVMKIQSFTLGRVTAILEMLSGGVIMAQLQSDASKPMCHRADKGLY